MNVIFWHSHTFEKITTRLESSLSARTRPTYTNSWCAPNGTSRNAFRESDFKTYAHNLMYLTIRKPVRGQDIGGAQQSFESGITIVLCTA